MNMNALSLSMIFPRYDHRIIYFFVMWNFEQDMPNFASSGKFLWSFDINVPMMQPGKSLVFMYRAD